MVSFDFLYDDEADGPMKQIVDSVSTAAVKAKKAFSEAMDTPTGKSVRTAATVGLVVGVALGTMTIVGAGANAVARTVFGARS